MKHQPTSLRPPKRSTIYSFLSVRPPLLHLAFTTVSIVSLSFCSSRLLLDTSLHFCISPHAARSGLWTLLRLSQSSGLASRYCRWVYYCDSYLQYSPSYTPHSFWFLTLACCFLLLNNEKVVHSFCSHWVANHKFLSFQTVHNSRLYTTRQSNIRLLIRKTKNNHQPENHIHRSANI